MQPLDRYIQGWRKGEDPRGPDPKALLESGQVSSKQLFDAVLADRDRLLETVAKAQAEKREFEEALLRSHQLVELQRAEIIALKESRRAPA
jgi:hypothetical protein